MDRTRSTNRSLASTSFIWNARTIESINDHFPSMHTYTHETILKNSCIPFQKRLYLQRSKFHFFWAKFLQSLRGKILICSPQLKALCCGNSNTFWFPTLKIWSLFCKNTYSIHNATKYSTWGWARVCIPMRQRHVRNGFGTESKQCIKKSVTGSWRELPLQRSLRRRNVWKSFWNHERYEQKIAERSKVNLCELDNNLRRVELSGDLSVFDVVTQLLCFRHLLSSLEKERRTKRIRLCATPARRFTIC